MPYSERAAGPNASYLNLESTGLPMHMGGVAIFDARPLTASDGTLEIRRIEAVLECALAAVPHGRQRLRSVPFEGQPVWIDDDRFNLRFHVRHTRLPRPGTERQLKRLAGRLMSERLDRRKPLWAAWVIEGLEGDRMALMLKLHPAMLDGIRMADLFELLGSESAVAQRRWRPRPAPGPAQMIADSLGFWSAGTQGVFDRVREALRSPLGSARSALQRVRAAGDVVADAWSVQRHPLLNPPEIGGHRRVDWVQLPVVDLERCAAQLRVSLLDVSLGLISVALRRFLHRRGERSEPPGLSTLIALEPGTSALGDEPQADESGVTLRVPLPITESDPLKCVLRVAEARREAMSGAQREGFALVEQVEAWTPARIQKAVAQIGGRRGAANLVVQFAEGPRGATSLLGAPLERLTVLAPLFVDQALGIAIARTEERLSFGLNSDWDRLTDLHEIASRLEKAAAELGATTARGGAALSNEDLGRSA